MRTKIVQMKTDIVNTKYGEKQVYRIVDEKGNKYDSWVGQWNADWMIGMEIEATVQTRGRYSSLVQSKPQEVSSDFEDACKGYFRSILLEIQALRKQLNLKMPATAEKAPMPKAVESPEDLPF